MSGEIRALLFDVFGTCVDWRSTIIREGSELNQRKGIDVDWTRLADTWRGMYQPAMQKVRDGSRPWTILDDLHRESLSGLTPKFGLDSLSALELDHLNQVWHRLEPWPDTVAGLNELKETYIIAPVSNGNVALLVNMAKHKGLPWDVILGAEIARHYKPQPEAYLTAVALLGLEPPQCMMVAAHNSDLFAARDCGLRTAFVCRPLEHGPGQESDLSAESEWDVITDSFTGLSAALRHA